eukprot:gene43214-58533_t
MSVSMNANKSSSLSLDLGADHARILPSETATVAVLANDSGVEGSALSVCDAVVTSGNGTVTINDDGSLSVAYTGPYVSDGFKTQIAVTYTATDGSLS